MSRGGRFPGLSETGVEENTLVVYASDNGGQLDAGAHNGPWRGAKQEMYEGGVRVPCCAMWPGQIPSGEVTGRAAMLTDLFPTVCEATGTAIQHEIEGRSMLPLLRGDADPQDDRVLYWVRREGGRWGEHDYLGQDYHAVRKGDLKLLHNDPFSPLELYDLNADPTESVDLAASDNPETGALRDLLQAQVQRAGGVSWQRPPQ